MGVGKTKPRLVSIIIVTLDDYKTLAGGKD